MTNANAYKVTMNMNNNATRTPIVELKLMSSMPKIVRENFMQK